MLDHGASSSSARSSTTTSAPCAFSASACPTRSTPTTIAELPGAPGFDARQRVLEDGRVRRARRRAPARRPGTCPAPACPAGAQRSATWPSMIASKRSAIPAAASTSRQLVLDETTAAAQAGVARGLHVANRALVGLDALLVDQLAARSRSCGCPARGSSPRPADRRRLPSGSSIPREARNDAHAVVARLAVDVLVVVVDRVERDERPRRAASARVAQERRRTSASTPPRAPWPSASARRRDRTGRRSRGGQAEHAAEPTSATPAA